MTMTWNVCNDKGEVIGSVQANSLTEARQKSINFTGRSDKEGTVYVVDNKGAGLYRVACWARPLGAIGVFNLSFSGTYQADSASEALDKLFQDYSDKYEFYTPNHISFISEK